MKNPDELFVAEALKPEAEIDLGRAALLIAKSEYPALDVEAYLCRLDQIAEAIIKRCQGEPEQPEIIIKNINEHLYDELGFRGNAENYYDPRNSFLNEVIDRRMGIPITLSVLYIEIARRLGLTIEGIGMPGHFLMKCLINGAEIFLDAFNGGRCLTVADCQQMLASIYGEDAHWQSSFLRVVSKREILFRMLSNLKNIYVSGGDYARALAIVERILMINPESLAELRDRGLLNFQLDRLSLALADLEKYLEQAPEGPEAEGARQYLVRIKARLASLN